MAIFTARLIQGRGNVFAVTLDAVAGFQGTEELSAYVNTGGTAPAILFPGATWSTGQLAGEYRVVDLEFSDDQASSLAPDFYIVVISLADKSFPLAYGMLEVIGAAGELPQYDWLTTPARVLGLFPELQADIGTLADLPRTIGAASDAIRKYCNRWFTRKVRTGDFPVARDGAVRLDEFPVNAILRVATGRETALTIRGERSAFQIARVAFIAEGDHDAGLTITGIKLTSITAAVPTETDLLFEDYPTIDALATAIGGVSGWSATVAGDFGQWPTSELVGYGGGVLGGGVEFRVYSGDAAAYRLDPETGFLYMGSSSGGWDGPAWGPDYREWGGGSGCPSTVRVTYDAGYDTIPESVALAAAQTVNSVYGRLTTDDSVQSERAGDYEYTIKESTGTSSSTYIPESTRAALASYRIYNA